MAKLWQDPDCFPYLLDPDFELVLLGRYLKGGMLKILHSGLTIDAVRLSASKWATLVALAAKGKNAAGKSPARAFMTVEELTEVLKRRTTLDLSLEPKRPVK